MTFPYLTCHWEARPAVGSIEARRPRVAGSTFVELTLPCTRQSELQDRIQSWHTQQAPHGLLTAPPFLLVSVARYANPVKGKNRIRLPCRVLQQASFPVFCDASDWVQWTSYRLIGGVMHLGSSPQSGHYRTFLAHPNPTSAQASLTTEAAWPVRPRLAADIQLVVNRRQLAGENESPYSSAYHRLQLLCSVRSARIMSCPSSGATLASSKRRFACSSQFPILLRVAI